VSVTVPTAVSAKDALLLYVTANRSSVSLQAPAGWQSLGQRTDDGILTQVWTRVATSSDSGATVTVNASPASGMTAQVAAYTNTDATNPIQSVASAAEGTQRTAHTAPTVTGISPSSWVVSLFSDRASTTGWSVNAPTTDRQFRANVDGQRVTAFVTDSAGPVGSTTATGVTATATHASNAATMWTIVLRNEPAP
jgi:hypothetical protein